MNNDQELIALGLGNLIIPFLGGVPASAAVARTSVAIRSGGRTRLVPIIHGLVLLAVALLIGPALERVPLAALGGVLLVTSVRVNDWVTMRFFVHRRLWHAVAVMLVTMVATYVFNLTQAVVIGMAVSVLWFVRQASVIDVSRQPVDGTRMKERGQELHGDHPGVEVVYVTGPLFFGNIATFLEALEDVPTSTALILSLRGMPTLDAVGVQAIEETILRQHHGGGSVHLVGLQPASRRRLERSGVLNAWERVVSTGVPTRRSRRSTPNITQWMRIPPLRTPSDHPARHAKPIRVRLDSDATATTAPPDSYALRLTAKTCHPGRGKCRPRTGGVPVRQTKTVPAGREDVQGVRHAGDAECTRVNQGVVHRDGLIFHGVPDERRRSVSGDIQLGTHRPPRRHVGIRPEETVDASLVNLFDE